MNDSARMPIVFRDIGAGAETVRISCWLVDEGQSVAAGDRIVEVRLQGVTFDVPAPVAGTLRKVEKHLNTVVTPDDILGWIEPEPDDEDLETRPPDN